MIKSVGLNPTTFSKGPLHSKARHLASEIIEDQVIRISTYSRMKSLWTHCIKLHLLEFLAFSNRSSIFTKDSLVSIIELKKLSLNFELQVPNSKLWTPKFASLPFQPACKPSKFWTEQCAHTSITNRLSLNYDSSRGLENKIKLIKKYQISVFLISWAQGHS